MLNDAHDESDLFGVEENGIGLLYAKRGKLVDLLGKATFTLELYLLALVIMVSIMKK